MNYFRLHIGDYLRDASHLSPLEDGMYFRALRVYYTREDGIPDADRYRLTGARMDDERAALDAVLREFFTLIDGQWRQSRCDREIAAYQQKAERNREVGKLGGNPLKKSGYNEPGVVYAVQRASGGPIKVGISKYVGSRLSALRSQHGDLTVLATRHVSDMGAVEAAVHAAFVGRIDGEWVNATWAEVQTRLDAAAAEVGSPDGCQLAPLANSQEPIAKREETEEERTPRRAPAARGSRIPDGFPAEPEFDWCREHRPELDPLRVGQVFRDHHLARGSTMKDWRAAWRTWVGKERAPLQRASLSVRDRPPSFMRAMAGGAGAVSAHQGATVDVEHVVLRVA